MVVSIEALAQVRKVFSSDDNEPAPLHREMIISLKNRTSRPNETGSGARLIKFLSGLRTRPFGSAPCTINQGDLPWSLEKARGKPRGLFSSRRQLSTNCYNRNRKESLWRFPLSFSLDGQRGNRGRSTGSIGWRIGTESSGRGWPRNRVTGRNRVHSFAPFRSSIDWNFLAVDFRSQTEFTLNSENREIETVESNFFFFLLHL